MNDTKYLIITYHKDAYFYPYLKADNIVVCEPIRNKSFVMRFLFRVPILCLFSYAFLRELKKADKIIVFDSAYNIWLGLFLKHYKKKNIFLYFWNPVKKMYPKNGAKMVANAKKLMPVFSFDHNDCRDYGLEYRSMVYSSDVIKALTPNNKPAYDVFFLGWTKDRSKQIEMLYNEVFKGNFKCLFILVGDEDRVVDDSIIYTTQRIPYSEYLEYVQNSKAILDIPQEGQEGLTIRNVEALFLNKKMITTNKNVVNYDLYCKYNIYIIDKDGAETMERFMHSELKEVDKSIKRNYDFIYWLNTFV